MIHFVLWIIEINKSTVKRKLRRNPNFFVVRDKDGHTLLHRLAWSNYFEQLELILKSGIDPNTRDMNGETPLHGAIASESEAACEILLKYGADLLIEDNEKIKPIDWITKYPNEKIQLLIEKYQ